MIESTSMLLAVPLVGSFSSSNRRLTSAKLSKLWGRTSNGAQLGDDEGLPDGAGDVVG